MFSSFSVLCDFNDFSENCKFCEKSQNTEKKANTRPRQESDLSVGDNPEEAGAHTTVWYITGLVV